MTQPIPPRRHRPQLPFAARKWLLDGSRSSWSYLTLRSPDDECAFWEEHRNGVLAHHIKKFPGTRPKQWWRFDSVGPRRRVGGIGTPLSECSAAVVPSVIYGVPMSWKTARHTYLSGGTVIDATDPPLYESEAEYLRRHRLFLPGERQRLSRRSYQPDVLLHRNRRFTLVRQSRWQEEQREQLRLVGPLRALLNVTTE